MVHAMSEAELRALPAVIDLPTAGRALGIGRTLAYRLARNGEFPCTLVRLDRSYRVITADLLRLLKLTADDPSHGALPEPASAQRGECPSPPA